MRAFTVKEPTTLEKFLDNNFPELTKRHLFDLYKRRDIKINGVRTNKNVSLKENDVVNVYISEGELAKVAFNIVYQDEYIIVCDKDANINSEAVFLDLQKQYTNIYYIHRLDRNTKGLMVFARTKSSEKSLLEAFKDNKIIKKYHALVYGRPKCAQENLQAYLIKDSNAAVVKIVNEPQKNALSIQTNYKVLSSGEKMSLVEVEIITGRTHQIRAHMAHIGHFVVGDSKYGIGKINKEHKILTQQLIATSIEFKRLSKPLEYLKGKKFTSGYTL